MTMHDSVTVYSVCIRCASWLSRTYCVSLMPVNGRLLSKSDHCASTVEYVSDSSTGQIGLGRVAPGCVIKLSGLDGLCPVHWQKCLIDMHFIRSFKKPGTLQCMSAVHVCTGIAEETQWSLSYFSRYTNTELLLFFPRYQRSRGTWEKINISNCRTDRAVLTNKRIVKQNAVLSQQQNRNARK